MWLKRICICISHFFISPCIILWMVLAHLRISIVLAINPLCLCAFCVCLDDVIVFSKDFESHLERLAEVCQRFQSAQLKLRPEKCQLFQREVAYTIWDTWLVNTVSPPIQPRWRLFRTGRPPDAPRKWSPSWGSWATNGGYAMTSPPSLGR